MTFFGRFWANIGMILARFPADFWIKYGQNFRTILWVNLGRFWDQIWANFWVDNEDGFGEEYALV
jgi:hypothetical protein